MIRDSGCLKYLSFGEFKFKIQLFVQLDLEKLRETSDEKDVANKLDIDRCFETSSKDGRGIDEVVDFLLEEVIAPAINHVLIDTYMFLQILRRNLVETQDGEQYQQTERVSLNRMDNMLDKKKCCKSSQ